MIQVVNGYVCLDCADVALAKKDINPAKPPNDPLASGSESSASNTQSTPAVSLGGVLSQLSVGAAVQQPNSLSQSASAGQGPQGSAGAAQNAAAQQPYSSGVLANLFV